MNRKFSRITLLIVILSLLLGALSVGAQEPVKVVWFVGLGAGGQPEQVEAQNKVVADFNASQSDIVLEIQIVDNNVAYDTLSTLIAAGQAPDIVGPVGNDGSNAFAGLYLGLDDLIASTGYDLSQFDEAAVESFRVDGQLIGLPFATFPSMIWYRTDLFDEAGLNYPPAAYGEMYVMPDGTEVEWTMDTLREVAMMLTVDANGNDATMEEFDPEAIDQWGFVSQWNEPRGISTMFGANTLIDEEGNAQLPEAWTTAFNWYYDGIWTDHFIPNDAQVGSDVLAAGNAFASGRVAMAHTHLWYTCCVGEIDTWNLAAMPSHNGVVTTKLHGDTFRILAATKNPEAAFTVLTYLLGDAAPELLQVYGGMPARAEQTEAFFATLEETFPQGVNWQVAVDSLAYADSPNHEYNMPNYLKAKDRIGVFQTLMGGTDGLDINAEMATLVADLQVIFDEAK